MNDATIAGSPAATTRATLARYREWSTESRDHSDAGSTYDTLDRLALTVPCCEIDLGIDL